MAGYQSSASNQYNDSFSSSNETITPPRPGSAGSRKRSNITSDSRSHSELSWPHGEDMVPGSVPNKNPHMCIGTEIQAVYRVDTEGTTYMVGL